MGLRPGGGGPPSWVDAELPGACHLRWPGWAGAAPLAAIKPRGEWEGLGGQTEG